MKDIHFHLRYKIIHSKFVKCFPGGPITAKGFINAMENVIKDNVLQKNNIKCHDYKTKTLLCFAEKYRDF